MWIMFQVLIIGQFEEANIATLKGKGGMFTALSNKNLDFIQVGSKNHLNIFTSKQKFNYCPHAQ